MLLSDRSRTPPPSNTSGIPTLPRFTPIPSIAAPVEPAMIRVAGAHFSCISSGRGLLKPLALQTGDIAGFFMYLKFVFYISNTAHRIQLPNHSFRFAFQNGASESHPPV